MFFANVGSPPFFELWSSLKFLLVCSDVPEMAQVVAVFDLLSSVRREAPMIAVSMLIMGSVVEALFPSIFDRFASFFFSNDS